MAIFTFMGSTIMRQDDNYTFHVIQQSIETVIPPLVQSESSEAVEGMSLGVLKVCIYIIYGFLDIAIHRFLSILLLYMSVRYDKPNQLVLFIFTAQFNIFTCTCLFQYRIVFVLLPLLSLVCFQLGVCGRFLTYSKTSSVAFIHPFSANIR